MVVVFARGVMPQSWHYAFTGRFSLPVAQIGSNLATGVKRGARTVPRAGILAVFDGGK